MDYNDPTTVSQTTHKSYIYPTQVSDVLNIQSTSKDFLVKIYNQVGSLIAEYENTNTIPFSNFVVGMYIVRIHRKTRWILFKGVKNSLDQQVERFY